MVHSENKRMGVLFILESIYSLRRAAENAAALLSVLLTSIEFSFIFSLIQFASVFIR